jgi:DNA-binding MarR family transcriptional regulator
MRDSGPPGHPLDEIDPVIHAPARLRLMTELAVLSAADFTWLLNQTGLTWGNLSSHLARLETAGYVSIDTGYRGRRPHTMVSLTDEGRAAFLRYRAAMQEALGGLTD